MSEPPKYDDLARRYLDLWQDHVAGAVSDPDAAKAMAMMLAGWQSLANSAGGAFGQGSTQSETSANPGTDPESGTNIKGESGDSTAGVSGEQDNGSEILSGASTAEERAKQEKADAGESSPLTEPETASPASAGADDVIRLLNRRIARLEERVAELERNQPI